MIDAPERARAMWAQRLDLPEAALLRAAMREIKSEPGKHYACRSGGFTRTGIWLDCVIGGRHAAMVR